MANLGILASTLDSDVTSGIFNILDKKKTKQDFYQHLMRGINVFSYSTFQGLHACERKTQISKLEKSVDNSLTGTLGKLEDNIDFAFGRAVESGVHAVLLKKEKHLVWFDMFQAWDVNLLMMHPKNKAKTFLDAWIAVEKFAWIVDNILQGWDLAYFNGKPAIELSLLVDMEDGNFYCAHVDVVLYSESERRYRILEIKTTGAKWIHPAMYKNSGQASGYSIVLDSIAHDLEETNTYEVFYLVYGVEQEQWQRFDFSYSRSNRASWINTILLDFNRVGTYKQVNFWPKRGQSCLDWGRTCQYYDVCDLDPTHFNGTGKFDIVFRQELDEHGFDFTFTLTHILETQKELI